MKPLAAMETGELAAYFHWNDRQCLEQATWVAQAHRIDWAKVEEWAEREGAREKFERFREAVQAQGDHP